MISLIKLHRKYLFNKINLIIIGLIILLAVVLSTILINPSLNKVDSWILRQSLFSNYKQTYLMFVKIIMILLSCYLFTIHFSKNNDEYKVLLLTIISKRKYFFTKIVTIILLDIIVLMILFTNYILIGRIWNNWFIVKIDIIILFIKILLLSIIYGLISLSLITTFKNIYSLLLSFSLFFFSEILIDFEDNKIVELVSLLIPTVNLENDSILNMQLLENVVMLFVLIILYYLLSYFLYHNRE